MEYNELYELALDSISDCFNASEDETYILAKKESKAQRTMRSVMSEANASDKIQEQIIMDVMSLYRSPKYGR